MCDLNWKSRKLYLKSRAEIELTMFWICTICFSTIQENSWNGLKKCQNKNWQKRKEHADELSKMFHFHLLILMILFLSFQANHGQLNWISACIEKLIFFTSVVWWKRNERLKLIFNHKNDIHINNMSHLRYYVMQYVCY